MEQLAQVHHADCQDNHPEGTGCRINLHAMLRRRATQTQDSAMVYVQGGWVERTTTVPVDAGVAAVVKFARQCWEMNLQLQLELAQLKQRLGEDVVA